MLCQVADMLAPVSCITRAGGFFLGLVLCHVPALTGADKQATVYTDNCVVLEKKCVEPSCKGKSLAGHLCC